MFVQGWSILAVDEVAGSMLLEQSDHGRAAGAAVEPGRERRLLRVVATLEEPDHPVRCFHNWNMDKEDPYQKNMFWFSPTLK